MNDYLTVSEINKYIKNVLQRDFFLNNVKIKGEISNLKVHTRGHLYFSLKDETSKINCIMFNYAPKINFKVMDGMNVEICGKLNVYEAGGTYQINVDAMKPDGVGNLYQLFEELKIKLNKEGLFDPKHKLKLPRIPKRIGVVTAPTGAAIRDIISTINKRFPMVEIIVFPSLVQGVNAKENIAAMIKKAEDYNIDVLIVGRGGGSIEDLWAFNEEIVARAIYNSKIPIVSAVGHEVDFTISDFVSDLRAPTPTGAAAYVVPDKEEILRYLYEYEGRIKQVLNHNLKRYYEKINSLKNSYILKNPQNIYLPKEQKLDIDIDKLNNNITNKLNNYNNKLNNIKQSYILNNPNNLYINKEKKLELLINNLNNIINKNLSNYNNKFDTLKLKLDLVNPKHILEKGYSLVKLNGKIIKDINDVKVKDNIEVILSNGKLNTEVKGIIENGK